MAITNQERVGKAMELLRAGLAPFVEREFNNLHQAQAADAARRYLGDDRTVGKKPLAEWDVAALLKLMWEAWNEVFGRTLGRAERSLVQELRDCRNKWAHQEPFSSDDADRALDSMARRDYEYASIESLRAQDAARKQRMADEAAHVGASPSSESYLRIDRIIEACVAVLGSAGYLRLTGIAAVDAMLVAAVLYGVLRWRPRTVAPESA